MVCVDQAYDKPSIPVVCFFELRSRARTRFGNIFDEGGLFSIRPEYKMTGWIVGSLKKMESGPS